MKCGECGIFEELFCIISGMALAGKCSLYLEIPTILASDHNPKCTKARPKGGSGVLSWGYKELPINGGGIAYQEKKEVFDLRVSSLQEEEKDCAECVCFDEELGGCPIFSHNREWSYAKKCKSFTRKGKEKEDG